MMKQSKRLLLCLMLAAFVLAAIGIPLSVTAADGLTPAAYTSYDIEDWADGLVRAVDPDNVELTSSPIADYKGDISLGNHQLLRYGPPVRNYSLRFRINMVQPTESTVYLRAPESEVRINGWGGSYYSVKMFPNDKVLVLYRQMNVEAQRTTCSFEEGAILEIGITDLLDGEGNVAGVRAWAKSYSPDGTLVGEIADEQTGEAVKPAEGVFFIDSYIGNLQILGVEEAIFERLSDEQAVTVTLQRGDSQVTRRVKKGFSLHADSFVENGIPAPLYTDSALSSAYNGAAIEEDTVLYTRNIQIRQATEYRIEELESDLALQYDVQPLEFASENIVNGNLRVMPDQVVKVDRNLGDYTVRFKTPFDHVGGDTYIHLNAKPDEIGTHVHWDGRGSYFLMLENLHGESRINFFRSGTYQFPGAVLSYPAAEGSMLEISFRRITEDDQVIGVQISAVAYNPDGSIYDSEIVNDLDPTANKEDGTFYINAWNIPFNVQGVESPVFSSLTEWPVAVVADGGETLTFDVANGMVLLRENVKQAGFILRDLYYDEAHEQPYDWTAPVSAPLTLYAAWYKLADVSELCFEDLTDGNLKGVNTPFGAGHVSEDLNLIVPQNDVVYYDREMIDYSLRMQLDVGAQDNCYVHLNAARSEVYTTGAWNCTSYYGMLERESKQFVVYWKTDREIFRIPYCSESGSQLEFGIRRILDGESVVGVQITAICYAADGSVHSTDSYADFNAEAKFTSGYFFVDSYNNVGLPVGGIEKSAFDAYTVTVMDGSSELAQYRTVEFLPFAGNVAKVGYTLMGLYADSEFVSEYDGSPITGNTTLYSKWGVTVSFAGVQADPVVIEVGKTLSEPEIEIVGGTFAGWYLDEAYESQFDFATPVTADLTLYAKIEWEQFTVRFYDGETLVHEVTVPYGQDAQAPVLEDKPGYTFYDWDTSFTDVTADLDVHAVYSPNRYTITLYGNAEAVADSSVEAVFDAPVPSLTAPERSGYDFIGWYLDSDCTRKFESDMYTQASDLDLYAGWSKIWSVTVEAGEGGSVQAPESIEDGQPLTVTVTPEKGYRVASVLINGSAVQADGNSYRLDSVTSDVIVAVTFEEESSSCGSCQSSAAAWGLLTILSAVAVIVKRFR